MGNLFNNPFRVLWASIWRVFYFLASHFDILENKILEIFSIKSGEKILNNMGFTEMDIIKYGVGLCVFVFIFQLFWNHFLDVDNEQMGQNKLGTTIKKFIISVFFAFFAISFGKYVETSFNSMILNPNEKMVDVSKLVSYSSNETLKKVLNSGDISNVKGCESIGNKPEYQIFKDNKFKTTATNKDIYDCYEVNLEYHDIENDSKYEKLVQQVYNQGVSKSDTHALETNDLTLVVIGIATTINLTLILLNILKLKWDIMIGTLISPFFASAFISRKSSAWHQFIKSFLGKYLSLFTIIFLIKFSFSFLETVLDGINIDDKLADAIFKSIIIIAFFGIIAAGSTYVNNFVGASGVSGASGGQGTMAAAGIGATASNIQNTARTIKSVPGVNLASKGAKTIGKFVGGKSLNGAKKGVETARNHKYRAAGKRMEKLDERATLGAQQRHKLRSAKNKTSDFHNPNAQQKRLVEHQNKSFANKFNYTGKSIFLDNSQRSNINKKG